jgi:hypothetical protein
MESYKFLIGEHRRNLIMNKFDTMKTAEMIEYVENKYIPAIHEVHHYLLMKQ